MKTKIALLMFFLGLLICPYTGMAGSKIEIYEPVFQFDPVPEGVLVSHSFVIKNTGDALLRIEKVTPP